MRALPYSILFLSLPAWAGPFEKFVGTPKNVTIAGPVDVPLYTSVEGSPVPCIEVVIGDKTFLFKLVTSQAMHTIGPDALTALGLAESAVARNNKAINWKGKEARAAVGGAMTSVVIDQILVGEMVLEDVLVLTEPLAGDPGATGEAFDGELSLPALEQVGWAILPSKGVVRFVPATDGAALVSSVGGTTYDYRSIESAVTKFGKSEIPSYPTPIVIAAPLAGKESPATQIAVDWTYGKAHPKFVTEGGAIREEGDKQTLFGKAELAGMVTPATFEVDPEWGFYEAELEDWRSITGIFGSDVLALFDVAADPVNKKIAFAKTSAQTRLDPLDRRIAEAEKGLTKPAPAEDAKPAEEPEEEWKPTPATLTTLAQLHAKRGELDKALQYRKQITEQEPRDCNGWLGLGLEQLAAGDAAGAVSSLSQASTLYHAWWDLPLEQRTEISKELAKLDPPEAKAHEHYAQPGSCFTSDGELAAAQWLKGDYAAVADLLKTKLDLDPTLPDAAANAAIVQNDWTAANAAYRQSLQLGQRRSQIPYLGLAVVYESAGDWASAREQLGHSLTIEPNDADALLLWLDLIRGHEGQPQALQAITDWAAVHPSSAAAGMVYFREAKRAGSEAETTKAVTMMNSIMGWWTATGGRDADHANIARHLLDLGKIDDAAKEVALAERSAPDKLATWFAKAELLKAKSEDTSKVLADAIKAEPTHPLAALVKAGKYGPGVTAAPAPPPTTPERKRTDEPKKDEPKKDEPKKDAPK